ncbi:MAG: MFS transporter [Clostridiaceae bacterium]
MEKGMENKGEESDLVINLGTKKKLGEKLWNINFILLLQGQLVSILGNTVYDIALRFWILDNTGSTALMGLLMAVTVLPEVFISPFAGAFIDRHDRKKILVITDAISGIAIVLIGIAAIMGFLKVWMILLVGIIVGICSCFFNPTIDSSIPDIVPKSKLLKANSAFSLMTTGNDIAGYAFGSFLVQIIGAPIVFLFNGISFLFSAVTECFIKIPKIEISLEDSSFWEDMKSGINFVKNEKGLKYLYVTISFLNFCASMSMTLTLPWFKMNNQLGISQYGIAMAINTFGMFLGFTTLSILELKKENKFYAFIWSGITTAITMIIFSITLNFHLIAVLFFINGFSIAITSSLIQSSMQNSVPSNMRSKAFAFSRTLSSALMPLGMVIAGVLGEKININIVIFADYAMYLVLFIYLSFLSKVKEIINI